MADHPRGDGFCPSGYDQSGDRWQQSDLHRQRPDDHPREATRCESRRRAGYRGHQRCAGDLPAAGRRRRALHPVGGYPYRRAAGRRYPRADTLRANGVAADGGVAQSAEHPLGDRCLSPLRRGGQPEYCARLRQRRGSAQPLSKAGAAERSAPSATSRGRRSERGPARWLVASASGSC